MESDTPPWSRRRRRRSWTEQLRRRATDALYEVIDTGFRIAAKLGRPSETSRNSEETRLR